MSASTTHIDHLLPSFTIHEATYKVVSDHPIEASIWLPNNLSEADKATPRPLILSFHGGFFVTGSRQSYEWLPVWQVELALRRGAIMLSADYRLLPESTGLDMLADLSDLLRWLPNNLPAIAAKAGLSVDLSRTLVTGESAGGRCAALVGLLHGTGLAGFEKGHESKVKVQAVISKFGSLNANRVQAAPREGGLSSHFPSVPSEVVDEHIAAVKAGTQPKICTGALLPGRIQLMLGISQNGRFAEFMGMADELDPLKVLDMVKSIPPMWCFHGKEDSILAVEATSTFVEKAGKMFGDGRVKGSYPAGDHGVGNQLTEKEGWVKEGLEWVERFWS